MRKKARRRRHPRRALIILADHIHHLLLLLLLLLLPLFLHRATVSPFRRSSLLLTWISARRSRRRRRGCCGCCSNCSSKKSPLSSSAIRERPGRRDVATAAALPPTQLSQAGAVASFYQQLEGARKRSLRRRDKTRGQMKGAQVQRGATCQRSTFVWAGLLQERQVVPRLQQPTPLLS